MKSVAVSVVAVMVLAGSALAAIPSTTDYLMATEPMISGKVVSVDDQHLVVAKDQGGQVTLVMDSRTMVPSDLAPGMVMRVEFNEEPDGSYYAKRIIPIRGGMSTDRELAYSKSKGGEEAVAQRDRTSGGESTAPGASTSEGGAAGGSASPQASSKESGAAAGGAAAGASSKSSHKSAHPSGTSESLPQTASDQPLILLLGALALGSAAVLAVSRRRNHA